MNLPDIIKFVVDLLAVLLLALGIKGLSKVRSAREANILAALTAIIKAEPNSPLLIIGSISLGFALFNVVGGFFVTDRMLAMFSRKPTKKNK